MLARVYMDIMNKYGVDPKYINLEITESASVVLKKTLLKNMDALIKYGDICYVKNILVYDLKNPYQIKKEDYMGDDANISVDTAYNLIKCEVDISSIDSDFINPFDKDAIQATTKWPYLPSTDAHNL